MFFRFECAYTDANQAIIKDNKNLKALYRRALALQKLGFIKMAEMDLDKCIKYDSNNPKVKELAGILKLSVKIFSKIKNSIFLENQRRCRRDKFSQI